MLPDELPIHEAAIEPIERALTLAGVAKVDAGYSSADDRYRLTRWTMGDSTVWLATDIGLARTTVTLDDRMHADIAIVVTPWRDVTGAEIHASDTHRKGETLARLGFDLTAPAFSEFDEDEPGGRELKHLPPFISAVLKSIKT
jgi:hypothetical protein